MLVLRIAYRVLREAYLVFRNSLVNLDNMVNLVKWLSSNLDTRLRHSRIS